jgi:hypothetical protein
MPGRITLIIGGLVVLVAAVALLRLAAPDRPAADPEEHARALPALQRGARPRDAGAAEDAAGVAEAWLAQGQGKTLTEDQLARVQAYLSLEDTRRSLQAYFSSPGTSSADPKAILETIDALERDGRLVGLEALHLKVAWLALNSSDEDDYRARARSLIDEYAERDRAARAAFDPGAIPGYTDYKVREAEIIAEVNGMDSFPQGQTRQQYLRERLLQARIEAYGER